MAAVLIPEHLDPKNRDVGPWGQIVFDIFKDPSDKEFYNGIVKDQQALVDLIKNSGITLTMPKGFLTTDIMTYDELKKKMPQILKSTVVHHAYTIPIAITPSLWKRTRTGAIQMWQGVGLATASPSDWNTILNRTTTSYAGNSELIGEIFDDRWSNQPGSLNSDVVMELVGFHGQQGSAKMQVKDPTEIVAKGNRTTYRQLTNELNSKYKKKLNRSHYEIGKPVVAVAGAFQMPIVAKITPMLAKNFSKGEGKRIEYPCVVQRKFDGVRCLCHISEGKVRFYSRKGVEYDWLNKSKIATEILAMFSTPVALARGFGLSGGKKPAKTSFPNSTYSADLIKGVTNTPEQLKKDQNGPNILAFMNEQMDKDGWWLDGELYSHELDFDRISGLARKKNRTEAEDEDTMKLGYRVYDFFSAPREDFYQVAHDNGYTGDPEDLVNDYKLAAIDHKSPYRVRYGLLALIYRLNQMDKVPAAADKSEINKSLTTSAVELTENIYVLREDQLEEIHDLFIEEGYEGLMLRNLEMPYEFSRSWNLVKYKVMKDDEYKIVDAEQSLKGKQKGAIIWICETPQGDRFNVVPNGTIASRKKLWDEWKADPKEFIGKELTVQYQELTPKGIPRFPKGIGLRDYE
jgi:hypothetical protein